MDPVDDPTLLCDLTCILPWTLTTFCCFFCTSAIAFEQTMWLQPWFFSIGLWPAVIRMKNCKNSKPKKVPPEQIFQMANNAQYIAKSQYVDRDQESHFLWHDPPASSSRAHDQYVIVDFTNRCQWHLSPPNNLANGRSGSEPWTLRAILRMSSDPADVLWLRAVLHIPLMHSLATRRLVSFFATRPAPNKAAGAMNFHYVLGSETFPSFLPKKMTQEYAMQGTSLYFSFLPKLYPLVFASILATNRIWAPFHTGIVIHICPQAPVLQHLYSHPIEARKRNVMHQNYESVVST